MRSEFTHHNEMNIEQKHKQALVQKPGKIQTVIQESGAQQQRQQDTQNQIWKSSGMKIVIQNGSGNPFPHDFTEKSIMGIKVDFLRVAHMSNRLRSLDFHRDTK